jgi:UDP-N-acetylmuramoyl-tripeptide--D-alanyl-D-alanine ligase
VKPIPLDEFAATVEGKLEPLSSSPLTGFATDSRHVKQGDLFIAIRGAQADGHDYIDQAARNGAIASLVERPVAGPYVLVGDVVQALARYGRMVRSSFEGPVVGITGSAGKTTTKEFVAAALGPLGSILKSQGNRNTEYTSPLLWSELEPDTCAVVVEMGMRGFGQIAHLSSVASPTVGIITNVGYAHLMQVGSREGIAKAKGELLQSLPSSGIALLWNGCEYLPILQDLAGARQVWKFGFESGSDCQVTDYKVESWSSAQVAGTCFGHPWTMQLGSIGRHVALDAAAGLLTAASLGVDLDEACDALSEAVIPGMRMEVREVKGATVLLDAYNASPPSMISALETVAEAPSRGRRLAVLGEMRELGDYSESGHRAIGVALKRLGLDHVLFIGDQMRYAKEEAGHDGYVQGTLEDAKALIGGLQPGDVVVVKGSRALELERVLETVGS